MMTHNKVLVEKSAENIDLVQDAPLLCISCWCLFLPGHTSFSLVLRLHVAYVQEIYCRLIHTKLFACYSWPHFVFTWLIYGKAQTRMTHISHWTPQQKFLSSFQLHFNHVCMWKSEEFWISKLVLLWCVMEL